MTAPVRAGTDRRRYAAAAMPRHRRQTDVVRLAACSAIAMIATLTAGCRQAYRPDLAATAYPVDRHEPTSIDVQVFREETEIVVVNATPYGYPASRMWLNRRWVRDVGPIDAGEVKRISLWGFRDDRGNLFNAGGFFRTERADPLRIVQLETPGDEALVGFVVVRERDR